jgi:hypothetical protein
MTRDEVRKRLAAVSQLEGEEGEVFDAEPVFLSPAELTGLKADDVPRGVYIEVGHLRDSVRHIEFEGTIARGTRTPLRAEMTPSWYRKYWPLPLGMGQYLDLFRRAIETRQRVRGDVELGDFDSDDDVWIHLRYTIHFSTDDLSDAYAEAKRIEAELSEAADSVCTKIEVEIAQAAQKLSSWGDLDVHQLLDQIDRPAAPDVKGRVLEELVCTLLETVPGFQVRSRIRTQTEEIDITVLNASEDAVWRREGALLLAECKNWSSKCGKNELVLFQEKMRNRHARCSCGFLVSWNGFAETLTKEMLRGSTGELMVVPIEGRDLRAAVRDGNFASVLNKLWEKTTLL